MNNLRYIVMVLALAALSIGGCAGGGSAYRLGLEAEREGHAHVAYDRYLEAARTSPDNAQIASAMRRVAPTAATYWTAQARIAHSQGRHADAWKAGMRALDIRPDQEEALHLVQALEREHPQDINAARVAWLKRGVRTLPAAPRVATAAPRRDVPSVSREEPSEAGEPSPHEEWSPETPPRERIAQASPEDTSADEPPQVGPRAEPAPREEWTAETPPPRVRERVAQAPPRPRRSAPPPRRMMIERPRPEPELVDAMTPDDDGLPVLTLTLAERDMEDERRVGLIDHVSIELCDVDDDNGGEVDVDLFEGNRRISKIRGLPVGRSRLFRSRSGTWFRLKVLKAQKDPALVYLAVYVAS